LLGKLGDVDGKGNLKYTKYINTPRFPPVYLKVLADLAS